MFKKIKENPYYIKFKEMRADPKLRPITSLIFWFIFMAFIIIFVKATTSTPSKSTQTLEKNTNTTSFKFTYTNDKLTIFGQTYNEKTEFTLGNNRYYFDGEKVYSIKNQTATNIPDFDLSILKITPKMIKNLTSNLTYTLNEGAKRYVVPLPKFLNLYEVDVPIDTSGLEQYNIIIETYEDNGKIYMYKLDLTNYYLFKGLNNDGILTIDIYDDNFTEYYDELVGGIKWQFQ